MKVPRIKVFTSKGVTLIELMVGLAVLSVLLTIGIPSFKNIIRDSRLTSQSNELLGSMMAARSEAVKRNAPVELISSDWTEGWQLTVKEGGEVLRNYRALSGNNSLACDDGCTKVTFYGSGRAGSAAKFTLNSGNGDGSRRIELSLNGKAKVCKPEEEC